MPYVDRDINGAITGVFVWSQYEGQEFVEGEVTLPPAQSKTLAEQILSDPVELNKLKVALGIA